MWTRVRAVLIPCIPAVLVGLAALLYLRFVPASKPTYDPAPQPVQTAPEVRTVTRTVTRRVVVPGPERIVYLDRQETAAALKMPELLASPDNVLEAVTIPCPDRDVTAVSLIDNTGQGLIIYRPERQKFFRLKKDFGLRAGAGSGGLILGEVYARPLRVGPVDVEVRGWTQRTDRDGADFGGAVLMDWRF